MQQVQAEADRADEESSRLLSERDMEVQTLRIQLFDQKYERCVCVCSAGAVAVAGGGGYCYCYCCSALSNRDGRSDVDSYNIPSVAHTLPRP